MFDKINHNAIVMQDCNGETNTYALTKVGMVRLIRHIVDLCMTDETKTLIDMRFKDYAKRNDLSITRPTKDFYISASLNRIGYYFNNFVFDKDCFNQAKQYLSRRSLDRNAGVSPDYLHYSWQFDLQGIDRFFTMKNMVFAITQYGKKYLFKDNVFEFGGYKFDKCFKSYLRTCKDCGEIFFSQNDMHEHRIDFTYLPSRLLGIDNMCRDCAIGSGCYFQCDDCGELFSMEDEIWIENQEVSICRDCFDNGSYATCQYCGAHFYYGNGDYVYSEQRDEYYCNGDCAENNGLHWSDYEEDWVEGEEDSRLLNDYHSTCFAKVGLMPKNAKQWLGCGIEVEVYGDGVYEHETFWQDTIINNYLDNGKYGNLEHDGSVTAEIVMQPMTEKEFAKFDFEGMYNALRSKNYTGHDNECCGQHIHFSRGYLGYNDNQIKNSAKKICAFFENNWDDLVRISRRRASQLNWCKRHGFDINQNTDFNNLTTDRYYAVNLTNLWTNKRGTIEIRIPRGTLNAKTTRATVDFFRHIVRNAKNISWENIDNLKLWFKGIKDQNTIDYIKSRDAFIGEF